MVALVGGAAVFVGVVPVPGSTICPDSIAAPLSAVCAGSQSTSIQGLQLGSIWLSVTPSSPTPIVYSPTEGAQLSIYYTIATGTTLAGLQSLTLDIFCNGQRVNSGQWSTGISTGGSGGYFISTAAMPSVSNGANCSLTSILTDTNGGSQGGTFYFQFTSNTFGVTVSVSGPVVATVDIDQGANVYATASSGPGSPATFQLPNGAYTAVGFSNAGGWQTAQQAFAVSGTGVSLVLTLNPISTIVTTTCSYSTYSATVTFPQTTTSIACPAMTSQTSAAATTLYCGGAPYNPATQTCNGSTVTSTSSSSSSSANGNGCPTGQILVNGVCVTPFPPHPPAKSANSQWVGGILVAMGVVADIGGVVLIRRDD